MHHLDNVEDIIVDPSFRRWILNQDTEARDQWQAFLDAHPEKKVLVEKARFVLEELSRTKYNMSSQEVADLWHQIEKKSEQPKPTLPLPSQKTRRLPWQYIAASITGVLLLVGLWYLFPQNDVITYHTNFGETQEIILPDGSQVTLNANSTLQFHADDFKKSSRNVWMQGEAFFKVKKVNIQPGTATKFFVHTDDLEIEVLGTQFNVNTRRTSTKVVLSEGKVRLSINRLQDNEPVSMEPGEMVTFTPDQNAVSKENVNVDIHTAWKQQIVIFDDTPLQEIIELLEDTYGLQIKLKKKEAAHRRYNGRFENPQPDKILMFVTQTFGLEIEHYGNVIILK